MSDAIVEVIGLDRRFDNVHAVQDVSFTIERNQVLGFIGANGAGKTTTMRIMATLDLPTKGEIRICGRDIVNFPTEARRKIGLMPESYGTYPNVTVWEYLDFFGRAFGFKGQTRRDRIGEVMEFTELTPIAHRMIDKLSKGMGQRLCLGRALLNDPELLILDEPAAGLDPKARIEFKRLVRLLAKDGKTIFVSSHILSELDETCDSMLFIDNGKIVHHGTSESLKTRGASETVALVRCVGDPDSVRNWALAHPGVRPLDGVRDGYRIAFDSTETGFIAESIKQMVADGIQIVEFRHEKCRLEDAFVDFLEKIEGKDQRG